MKTLKLVIISVFVALFVMNISSCKKDETHLGKKKLKDILLWSAVFSDNGDNADFMNVPAIDENDNIYVFSFSGNIYTIKSYTKDGALNWETQIGDQIKSRLAYKSGKIIFISYDNNAISNYLNCIDAKNGNSLWKEQTFFSGSALALTDNGIITVNNFNYSNNDNLCKYNYDGALLQSSKINNLGSEEYTAMTVFNNNIYLLAGIGNTSLADLYMFTDDGSAFTKDWNLTFSTDNGFSVSEDNVTCDLSVNKNGDVYLITNKNLYSISNTGAVNWKNENIGEDLSGSGIYKYTTITDSSFILTGDGTTLYKFTPSGFNVWDFPEEASYRNGPAIGNNGIYYTAEFGDLGAAGIKAINYDGTFYWYSLLPAANEHSVLLHNGNLIAIENGEISCIETESGGLSINAEWPKIYYDYGNTCCKK